MAKTRLMTQPTPLSGPTSPTEWDRLIRRAIARADLAKDTRATVLRLALNQGKTVQALRRMGIIGETDLQREFPIREE